MLEELAVEVLGMNQAFYKAYVKDINGDLLTVVYEYNLQQEIQILFNSVRLPPPADYNPDIGVGDVVEVYSRVNELESFGWRVAHIETIIGEGYLVEYCASGPSSKEYVTKHFIRPCNPNSLCCQNPFRKICISAQKEMRESWSDETIREQLRKAVAASSISYNAQTRQVTLLFNNEPMEHPVVLPSDTNVIATCFDFMPTSCGNRSETSEQGASLYVEEVKVKKNLTGLAIGPRGANIQRARNVPGVIAIKLDDESNTFKIWGQWPEAVKLARECLEFTEEHFQVPRNIVGKIIGKKGKNIQEILDLAGTFRVQINDDNKKSPQEEDMVPFLFVGTKKNISTACAMLTYQITYLQEMEVHL